MDADKIAVLQFCRRVLALRRSHSVFRRPLFLSGAPLGRSPRKDITWLRADGREMDASDWGEPARAAVAFRLDGDAIEPLIGSPDGDDVEPPIGSPDGDALGPPIRR